MNDATLSIALSPATGGFWHDRAPRPLQRLPTTRESADERRLLWDECDRLSMRFVSHSAISSC